MEDTESSQEKRVVEQLEFDARTAKRAGWEQFEFTVVGPLEVEVANASYGDEKDDHTYLVEIEKRAGVPVPDECECPADNHRNQACKHRIGLATIGGLTVLNAAASAATLSASNADVTPSSEKIQTDGGTVAIAQDSERCPNDDPSCNGPEGENLPCFDCYEISEGL